ncbi:MAG: 23S rRNA (adenine(2503)-C(2))-methyltransferase RlmN [Lachnospiraceae bacterium]|nr:23S rRNA (adenine(2503)-C(2))-methyltransferase RlmN [Lachnospiraceae bacterium]MBR3263397.1 23S rRNA (adenine(2503)-C(2))-methyltransferase RlmN [Lachnospiraceae bacterium]MBR7077083.1 23S rRNA (adenine(2503)-C(2))-methyltransferase RlmN [Lachnospiraceae bacterium]
MNSQKIDIKSLQYDALQELVKDLGQPKYRAGQIFSWLHEKGVRSFEEMTNLPESLRKELSEKCDIVNITKKKVLTSSIDGTKKYLFELQDGHLIESVMMRYKHGNSVCVSSQVGCAMGCSFCASTLNGCVRDLRASEILDQVYEIQKDIGERVSNIVIMGMGEPLINYDHVVGFVRIVSAENALHISQRNITISTCGIVPAIIKLSKEQLKVTLALSLHAPNDDIRKAIMPIAKKYSMQEILDACDSYFQETGRRVTFEYCLIDQVNDRPEHARELAKRLKGKGAHVNLIPVNPTPENHYHEAKEKEIRLFTQILEDSQITVTRRREMGRDISGACGQLVRRSS